MGKKRSLIIRPDYCVFTSAGPEHLSSHGSMERLFLNKSEIVTNMTQNGIFLLNADDFYAKDMEKAIKQRNNTCKYMLMVQIPLIMHFIIDKKFVDNRKWKVKANILNEVLTYEVPLLEEYVPLASISVLLLSKLLEIDCISIP